MENSNNGDDHRSYEVDSSLPVAFRPTVPPTNSTLVDANVPGPNPTPGANAPASALNQAVGPVILKPLFCEQLCSSADVLFYKVYQQIELGDIPLELVDTSLYGFVGEVVHSSGQILLPISLGTEPTKRKRMVRFLVVYMPSAYNLILGQPALNTFQAVVSTYHMKLKFLVGDKVREVKGDQYIAQKCYMEVIRGNSGNMEVDLPNKEKHMGSSQQDD
ncbi:UNVERIFIED_CONTAM: hypothetical protein Sangu_1029300 [Sesamum angustifolium]|uniref:Uncharacterized protein n=1 Tax=Sesamum angustifolium TaxID=2727405 RepID=A0AAW2NVV4_9LAMI